MKLNKHGKIYRDSRPMMSLQWVQTHKHFRLHDDHFRSLLLLKGQIPVRPKINVRSRNDDKTIPFMDLFKLETLYRKQKIQIKPVIKDLSK